MSNYSKDDARELDQMLDRTAAKRPDLTEATAGQQIKALQSLVALLESATKIVDEAHYCSPKKPEPYPGACRDVVRQARAAVMLARNSGLIP
jgi:hypothetical protein